MQQESQNQNSSRMEGPSHLRVLVNSDSSVMSVEVHPDFSLSLLGCIGLVFLTLFGFLIEEAVSLVMFIVFDIVFWVGLAHSVFVRRKIHCSINKITGSVRYYRGGVINTKFDESETNIKIADVTGIELMRYIRKYGDTFQILLTYKRLEKMELTGRNLSFSECQTYSEKIRNFIDPALPIKAMD